jgi:hypothetical protein
MTGRNLYRYVITCDGCGMTRGADGEFASSMEARAAVYSEGWRFPPKIRKDGNLAAVASDVCPTCLPTFTTQAARP